MIPKDNMLLIEVSGTIENKTGIKNFIKAILMPMTFGSVS
jgi:hypothetical protein